MSECVISLALLQNTYHLIHSLTHSQCHCTHLVKLPVFSGLCTVMVSALASTQSSTRDITLSLSHSLTYSLTLAVILTEYEMRYEPEYTH